MVNEKISVFKAHFGCNKSRKALGGRKSNRNYKELDAFIKEMM